MSSHYQAVTAAARTALQLLLPQGGQGRARRNAADAMRADRMRARARQEAWAALEQAAETRLVKPA